MQVELEGRTAGIIGVRHAVADAVAEALAASRAHVEWLDGEAPGGLDILILSHDLVAASGADIAALLGVAERAAQAMAAHAGGRIVHLVSAMAVIPMRRHAAFSAAAAGIAASVRALAMNAAPHVLVNAVAAGAISAAIGAAAGGSGELAAGDAAMLSHVPLGREGTLADIAHAALFLVDPANSYTTGQVLSVDGGWTAGYGRNF